MSNDLYIVDETGAVIDTIDAEDRYIKLSDGDVVLRKGAINYLEKTIDVKYRFVKINPVVFDKYCKKYSILPTLVSHIGYMNNIISYKNGKRINIRSLSKICGVSESTIKRQLNGLIEDDLLHKTKEDKQTILIMNPYLCMRGRRIYKSLYDEFKMSHLRSEIEEWEK